MDLKKNKDNLNLDLESSKEPNFRSLYGLTPTVENAISVTIRKKIDMN